MNNILSIFKNKKILFALLLCVFLSSGLLFFFHNVAAAEGVSGDAVATDKKDATQCESSFGMFKAVGAVMADILLYAPKQIAYWSTRIASWTISMVLKWPITNTSTRDGAALAFYAGWVSVRDLANMLIVLGFVLIGVAFTLRLENYGSKKALINLIIIAVLINFSGVFCGLFIDASNLAMTGLVKGTPGNMGIKFYSDIENKELVSTCQAIENNNLGKYIMADILFGVIYGLVAFCFIYLAIILIARYAYLGILFILSPLAFVCWAIPIPKLKDVWNKWWSEFLKWIFIGVSTCFFLNIAGKMLESFPDLSKSETTLSTLLFYMLIVIIVIVVGIRISTKQSGVGALVAGGLMATATGGASLAMGATGLRGLAQRGGEAIKDTATKFGESKYGLGLVSQGTTALNQQKRLAESSKRLGAKFEDNPEGNAGLAKLATGRALTAQQKNDKAAAGELLAKRNAMGAIEEGKREGVARYSTASGADKNTFTKVEPGLSFKTDKQKTKEATQQLKEEEKIRLEEVYGGDQEKVKADLRGYRPSEAAIVAKKGERVGATVQENKLGFAAVTDGEAIKRIREEYNPTGAEIKTQMATGTYRNESEAKKFLQAQFTPTASQLKDTKEAMTKERVLEKAIGFKHATREDARGDLMSKRSEELRKSKIVGKDFDEAMNAFAQGLTDDKINTGRVALNQERKSKAFSKLGGGQIKELPKEAFSDIELIKSLTDKKLDKIAPDLSKDRIDELKKFTNASHEIHQHIKDLETKATAGDKAAEQAARKIKETLVEIDSL